MKVLQINIFGNLSTGRIAADIYRTLRDNGHDGIVAFARNSIEKDVPYIQIGNKLSVYTDGIMTRLTDRAGFYSQNATRILIEQIKKYNPDIIHLHNLHGYFINLDILFEYLAICGKPVVWTLHDCWAYTGHCCYYTMANCKKWKNGCYKCPQKRSYPGSWFIDNSKENYKRKKALFCSVARLNLVCVSKWLEEEVKQSFLKKIPSRVIYNGVDTSIFKPTISQFKQDTGMEGKYIILGVASTWDTRKGLQDFIELSRHLDNKYKIVLVGLDDKDKKQIPSNILGIGRTDTAIELAKIYSSADVFVNASVEETFGLPTAEALACGTPVIVYNSTALPEIVDINDGYIVEPHNIEQLKNRIIELCHSKRRVATENFKYDKKQTYIHYMNLYEELL